jgi:hypothetical protein
MDHMRRGKYKPVPPILFPCPHCQHDNTAAEIVWLDTKTIQCAKCAQGFQPKREVSAKTSND